MIQQKKNYKFIVCVCFSIIPSDVITQALPWVFRLFWIPPQNPYLHQATQIFLPQKILWSSLSLEIQCTPPGSTYQPDIIASENHAYGPSLVTSMHITFLQRQDNIIPNKVLNTRCMWHLYCNAKYHTVGHYYSFTLYNIMQQEKAIKQFMIL